MARVRSLPINHNDRQGGLLLPQKAHYLVTKQAALACARFRVFARTVISEA